ncbi:MULTISPECIES: cytochrome c biogenesis heme-transporting ATPase CcmA [Marinobacter]|uniref:Cytochrome c biogenesis ATP-binding export protein CcmA n=1 Tax=Marinobacter nauticus TaxID=2743 RepID=A0A455W2R3_MARNT|nr:MULTISPECIES: cytochrome c biogenesis heme-transporting ATPase CcmA [Marinobacter]BBJ03496.1 cytochrome c biogenesis ATP-binding export protein CcmA [Marinobacter nauticus]MAO14959.1 heme ABC transporter ATP-binding protein CcmA [Marinobacter sp.]MCD1630509.1 cytochrome c biogenesis heme-transporting ATPase CcmA [Marinobacter shengliensis]MDX5327597.1 cytochrome c biogenesis heme-transporting ATPase CcmA [Marinobacter sp.]MDX5472655.1 cytochrome c biogenesis heme-transporting ATPase CcmA [M
MSEPLLQAVDLECERDERLLFQNLSFSIVPGTLTRVEGPNGSGKTTLLRILAGLNDAWSGDILWCGQPRGHDRESFHRNTLYLGHRPGIKPLLTPMENLRALMAGRRPVNDEVLAQALAGTGLAGYEHVPCRNLSAGQQRRVALARLLIADEPLWLLDEVFTAIDADGVQAIETLLKQRAAEGGAILVTTHHDLQVEGMGRITLGGGQCDE